MAEVRVEQAHRQDQFRVELDVSRASNEELRRTNEELRRDLQHLGERVARERSSPIPVRARPMPFSQAIMNVVIPTNFMTPKITFTSTEYLDDDFRMNGRHALQTVHGDVRRHNTGLIH